MNPRSRHYARRMMFAARRKVLALLKDAVFSAHVETREARMGIMAEVTAREESDLSAEAYYAAREMAHFAHLAQR
jgi:hypothetical protein